MAYYSALNTTYISYFYINFLSFFINSISKFAILLKSLINL
jgi:hypothetical protein